jgi:hypothetical protein
MSVRARLLFQLVRSAAFVILALILLVRLGPLCETMAMAATPVTSATMDCASTPIDARAKKIPLSACAMPCAAVPGETIIHVEPIAFAPLSPWTVAHTGVFGPTSAPATPPPQSCEIDLTHAYLSENIMTKFKLISATFAFTLSTGAFAAVANCCATWRAARTAQTAARMAQKPRLRIAAIMPRAA